MLPSTLTLDNLQPSEVDKQALKLLSKAQRTALFNLCTILQLTCYEREMRVAAERLRDLIRKNTLAENNVCDFDKTKEQLTKEVLAQKNA